MQVYPFDGLGVESEVEDEDEVGVGVGTDVGVESEVEDECEVAVGVGTEVGAVEASSLQTNTIDKTERFEDRVAVRNEQHHPKMKTV